ncbi:hypothetical protein SLEP1_g51539 [Rubroshorea leprosula]|uniref:CCHC-type domain-containing protein n=1 Tax=Rubroshorea leprosula TaxID=152421 RepID=A0AAV5M3K3_9ROSI|nr:hypothetical protein SLEP1_g51539 [Rubroshorea leprosula]
MINSLSDIAKKKLTKDYNGFVRYENKDVQVEDWVEFTTKSMPYVYNGSIYGYMSGIDLSCNHLTGRIPLEIGYLNHIHALNLSHNKLTGPIPSTFSNLKQIESLDLSYNNLSGRIPPQLIELNTLSVFSIAHNNLSGSTPDQKAQFGTFDKSSYEGNPFLCGAPLLINCTKIESPSVLINVSDYDRENNGLINMNVFYWSFVDKLKEEFQGDTKAKQIQVVNLRRKFEVLRMKETKTVKEFSDRVMKVVNQIRILGEELTEKRIVDKVLVSLPEKFEHKISSLEDSKDMTQMTLSELVNVLQVVEQRKAIRQEAEGAVEGAFIANESGKGQFKEDDEEKQFLDKSGKEKRDFQNDQQSSNYRSEKKPYPPCLHCGKMTHLATYCWFRPGVKCKSCKQFGHVEKVCKAKAKQYEKAQVAKNVDQKVEELFMAAVVESCSSTFLGSNSWLIDNGCTHHMTSNLAIFKTLDRSYFSMVRLGNGAIFKTLDRSYFSMVRLGNGEVVEVKGKGTVIVNTPTALRLAIKEKEVQILYCSSEDQLANFSTKPMPNKRFEEFRDQLDICSFVAKEEVVGTIPDMHATKATMLLFD